MTGAELGELGKAGFPPGSSGFLLVLVASGL